MCNTGLAELYLTTKPQDTNPYESLVDKRETEEMEQWAFCT